MTRLILLALTGASFAQSAVVLPPPTRTVVLRVWHVSWQDISDSQGRVSHVPVLVRRDEGPKNEHVRYTAPPQLGIAVRIDDTLRQARLASDTGALDQILSDEFFEVDQNGRGHTKSETIASLRGSKIESLVNTHVIALAADNAVSITGEQEEVAGTRTVRSTFTHVYVRDKDDQWKLLSSALTKTPDR